MSEHAPVPWHTDIEWANVVFAGEGTTKRVCYCYSAHSDFSDEAAAAHARLIAAAPDLLAACHALIDADVNGMTAVEAHVAIAMCKAAVAKVEGN